MMRWHYLAVAAFGSVVGVDVAAQHGAESRDMRLVGHNDLQARSAYQPVIQKQGNRWIAYTGHHVGASVNPLTGNEETNGTSVVDVTDPAAPKYLAHIPGPKGGESQMVRVCLGSDLPRADRSKVYLLRTVGRERMTPSAQEIWDVTDPAKPTRITVVVENLTGNHKNWWECKTGIAYLVSGDPKWRTPRMAKIYDLSDPTKPVFIRDFGLWGQQPGGTGEVPPGLHGPISVPEANRVYFGYGPGFDGVVQIVDREKLLNGPKEPTEANLLYPQITRIDLPPDAGAHSTNPLLGMQIAELAVQRVPEHDPIAGKDHDHGGFAGLKAGQPHRDFIGVVTETHVASCTEPRKFVRFIDVSFETKPIGVSSFTVPEASGKFCDRGGRFGPHASFESFSPIYYGRVFFIAHFNAGVRAIDIRDPFDVKEIAFYIPATTKNTEKRCATYDGAEHCGIAIQTSLVEVDDRGYIYTTDRASTGLHILELTGAAREVANFPK